jgi:hypothetical protein
MQALFRPLPGFDAYRETVRSITRSANEVLFEVVDDVMGQYRDGRRHSWTPQRVRAICLRFEERLRRERDSFVARNKDALMQALQAVQPALQPSFAGNQ